MKLLPMIDYVLLQKEVNPSKHGDNTDMLNDIFKYAEFLKQPIKLSMFLPCDDKGMEIIEPTDQYNTPQYYGAELNVYQDALSKVVFKNVTKRPINEHGSFALDVNGYQIAYYKEKPNYWVGFDKTVEELAELPIELNDNFKL